MIHVNPIGLRPEALTMKVGMPVVWYSYAAYATSVVATANFLKGEVVAQATQPVAGMREFVRGGELFVGRMEGNNERWHSHGPPWACIPTSPAMATV